MNYLIKLEDINPKILFNSDTEVSEILRKIEESASSIVCDVNTAKGRKEIASIASKVAKSKTYIDGLGKDLVSDIKETAKKIDNRRKFIRDSLDSLKETVRAPLTEFENIEKRRIALIEENLSTLRTVIEYIPYQNTIETLNELLKKSNNLKLFKFDEYQEDADNLFFKISDSAESKSNSILESERIAAENERLKKEAEEAARKAREKEIAENARREAEERVRREEQARIDAERRSIEMEKLRIKEAEEARIREIKAAEEAKIREKENKRLVEIRIKEAEERARQAEIQRQTSEKEAIERAQKIREADKKHKNDVNSLAAKKIAEHGIPILMAQSVVNLIASGKIDGIKMIY